MFPRIKTRGIFRIIAQEPGGLTLHKATHSAAQSVISCKGLPPSTEQILEIHLSS